MRRDARRCPGCVIVLGWAVAVVAIALTLLVTWCNRDPPADVYLESASDGRLVRLTRTWDTERNPAWSPFGDKIAYECFDDGGSRRGELRIPSIGARAWPRSDMCVMNADGSGQGRLTVIKANDADPSWSPDGVKVAFSRSYRQGGIQSMNSDGTGQQQLVTNGSNPSWSPDGSKIAFSTGRGISVMNADGSYPTRVTGASGSDGEPTWSPDGTQIAFASESDEGSGIFVVNLDGTGERLVHASAGNPRSPAWSPDGRRIAFVSDAGEDGVENLEIFIVNIDGTGLTRLTNRPNRDSDPAWSPDGRRIVFTSNLVGNSEIYVMDVGP